MRHGSQSLYVNGLARSNEASDGTCQTSSKKPRIESYSGKIMTFSEAHQCTHPADHKPEHTKLAIILNCEIYLRNAHNQCSNETRQGSVEGSSLHARMTAIRKGYVQHQYSPAPQESKQDSLNLWRLLSARDMTITHEIVPLSLSWLLLELLPTT